VPHLTDLDHVRLLVGDTDVDDAILSDDEITAFIEYRQITNSDDEDVTNIPAAAADAAAAIAAKFARQFNFAEDGQRFDRAQKYAHYVGLEQSLRRRAGGVASTT
jgi:hypothetical protein